MKLQLLGSSKSLGEDGLEYLSPATLRAPFLASVAIPNRLRRGESMRDDIAYSETGWINSGEHYAANTNFHPALLYDVMITQLVNFHFACKTSKKNLRRLTRTFPYSISALPMPPVHRISP